LKKLNLKFRGKHGVEASRAKRGGAAGFTVLEVLIAVAILGVGFAALLGLLGQGTYSHRSAVDTTQAAILASSVFSDIELNFRRLYADKDRNGVPDGWQDFNGNGRDDRFDRINGLSPAAREMPHAEGYDYSIEYHYSTYTAREIFVTCRVIWKSRDDAFSLPFRRIIFLKNAYR